MPKKRARNGRRSRKNGGRGIRGGFGGIANDKMAQIKTGIRQEDISFLLRLAKNLRTEVSLFFQEAFVHHMNSFFFKWFPGDVGDIQIIFGFSNKDTGILRSSH